MANSEHQPLRPKEPIVTLTPDTREEDCTTADYHIVQLLNIIDRFDGDVKLKVTHPRSANAREYVLHDVTHDLVIRGALSRRDCDWLLRGWKLGIEVGESMHHPRNARMYRTEDRELG